MAKTAQALAARGSRAGRGRAAGRARRVVPGFGLAGGVTLTVTSLVVIIPLACIAFTAAQMGPAQFAQVIARPRTLSSLYVSFSTALVASLVNAVAGVLLAWVLVRYRFPCRGILDGMVELPLAPPGIHLAYTRVGITIALVFVGIPFVTRAVQPVLGKLDSSVVEAARVMGASDRRTFWRVIMPELFPAALTGFGLALSRCLGEYGSVVFIAGNMPFKTEIAPLVIMGELQEFDYASATAIAVVMLLAAFAILVLMGLARAHNAGILRGGE